MLKHSSRRLRDSLEKDLVCPFHYFGIKEVEGIDYTTLKHNPEDGEEYLNEVSSLLMKSKRVDYILEKINFYKHDGDKTKALGFCATVKHAEFMAEEFNKILGQGSAIALSGNNSVTERQKYLKELESDDLTIPSPRPASAPIWALRSSWTSSAVWPV
mgnify:CR=1 FL=1